MTLAGTMVAYEQTEADEQPEGEGTSTWSVLVRDLRTGRWVHRAFTGTARQARFHGVGPVVGLVVKTDGSVAWIAEVAGLPGRAPTEYEVHAVDKSGSRVLASGTEIAPKSLALSGSTLRWTAGGKLFSAPLD
jgi:hypothetical protein